MVKKLMVPKESEDIKNLLLCMWVEIGHSRLGDKATILSSSADVWDSANILSQYLWKT